MSSFCF